MAVDQGRCPPSWCPVFRILYRFLSALVRLAVRSGRSKDLEIIMLRHHLAVLRRQVDRPAIDHNDRTDRVGGPRAFAEKRTPNWA